MTPITPDEFSGQGGSYTLDPVSGKRTRTDQPQTMPEGGGARGSDGKPLFGAPKQTEPVQGQPQAAVAGGTAPDAPAAGANQAAAVDAPADDGAARKKSKSNW